MKRRAPASGYNFPNKESYRRSWWSAAAAHIDRTAHVLIMPSKEGKEIPLLLDLGFKEECIHAVDESAAVIATAAWRSKYPRVQVYGNELPRAMERIRERIGSQLEAANFDLCGSFSGKMLNAIRGALQAGALAENAVLGLTMLKGRDDPAAVAALGLFNAMLGGKAFHCEKRLDATLRIIERETCRKSAVLASGEYRSQTQQMVWVCALLKKPVRSMCELCRRRDFAPLDMRNGIHLCHRCAGQVDAWAGNHFRTERSA